MDTIPARHSCVSTGFMEAKWTFIKRVLGVWMDDISCSSMVRGPARVLKRRALKVEGRDVDVMIEDWGLGIGD